MRRSKICQNCFEESATHNGLCKACHDAITAPPIFTDEELNEFLSKDAYTLQDNYNSDQVELFAAQMVALCAMDAYDNGQVDIATASKMINIAQYSRHFWGDDKKITECLSHSRCGRCLRIIPKGNLLHNIYTLDEKVHRNIGSFLGEYVDIPKIHPWVCESCLRQMVENNNIDEVMTAKLKKAMSEHYRPRKSTGDNHVSISKLKKETMGIS